MTKLVSITGKAISGEWGFDDDDGNGIPVLRTTNFTNDGVINFDDVVTRKIVKHNYRDKLLRKGDIIIEKSGGSDKQPVGRVVFFDGEDNVYLFNNFTGLLRIKDSKSWFSKYVFYALFAKYHQGATRSYENRTTGLHNLQTESYVNNVEIPCVTYDEQIKITTILDQVSAIQAARQKQLRALDELVKARFIEMFGDKDSEMKPLIVVCGFIDYRGKTPQKSEKGIPLITAKNVKDEGFSVSPQEFIPEENYEQVMTRGIPQINDVLFTTEAPLGNVCRIPPFLGKFCVGQRIITMHPKEELLTSEYLEFALRSKEFQNAMWQQSSGSTVKGIRSALLEKIKIPVPSMNLQISFSKLVRQVDYLKSKLRESLTQTETLFNSLMQQYFG
ncbi:MAG: restriction endonuclease subunit S [Thermoguttaceae bacterium]|nr:restriction endonuclease subunit S [Thermoguttaceae bacterium]